MKTLHLLRHAKSDWSSPSRPDHDRALNGRGKRARQDVAAYVAGWPVDLVVSSTARRARATAKPVVEALHCPVRFEAELYAAERTGVILELIGSLPTAVETVMLVGHNPWIEQLTALLCDGTSPRYPTAALGTVALGLDRWADVAPGRGTLVAHVTPSQLRRD
jgi:phosphohistidine phosphatase